MRRGVGDDLEHFRKRSDQHHGPRVKRPAIDKREGEVFRKRRKEKSWFVIISEISIELHNRKRLRRATRARFPCATSQQLYSPVLHVQHTWAYAFGENAHEKWTLVGSTMYQYVYIRGYLNMIPVRKRPREHIETKCIKSNAKITYTRYTVVMAEPKTYTALRETPMVNTCVSFIPEMVSASKSAIITHAISITPHDNCAFTPMDETGKAGTRQQGIKGEHEKEKKKQTRSRWSRWRACIPASTKSTKGGNKRFKRLLLEFFVFLIYLMKNDCLPCSGLGYPSESRFCSLFLHCNITSLPEMTSSQSTMCMTDTTENEARTPMAR